MVIFKSLLCGAHFSLYFTLRWAHCWRIRSNCCVEILGTGGFLKEIFLCWLIFYDIISRSWHLKDIALPFSCVPLWSTQWHITPSSTQFMEKHSKVPLKNWELYWRYSTAFCPGAWQPELTCVDFMPIWRVQTVIRVPLWFTSSMKLCQKGHSWIIRAITNGNIK
jgi:hypothetical protein